MTENPIAAPARLDDDEGGTLHVYPWLSGRVSLVARDGDQRVEFGPVERHVLLDAIREATWETKSPVSYNHVHITSEDVTPEQIAEALGKETTPAYQHVHVGTTPTADDFARAEFARHEDGRIAARADHYHQPWWVHGPTMNIWHSDAAMAEEGWQIVTPAEDSISRAELDARLARRDEAHKRQVARMQRHIETLQGHLARRRKQIDEMRDQMAAMTPAPSTPREALALAVDLAYEVEGDTMPDQRGYMIVGRGGRIDVFPAGNPVSSPARGKTFRYLLLDPPAPVTPAWHNARIVRATLDDVTCEWAQETSTLWRSLDGHGYIATADALTDVTVVVPGEVEA